MTPRAVARALAGRLATHSIEDAGIEAEVLVRYATGLSREALYAGEPACTGDLEQLTRRRIAGEPLAYITGTREFYGHTLSVTPDVLIPRQETEILVEVALAELEAGPGFSVADVGTGSACIATAIALGRKDRGRTVGIDFSVAALRVAHRNTRRLSADVQLVQSDLAFALGGVDVIVANLPYVPSATIATLAREVRDREPLLALDGGVDGLDLIRRLIDDCATRLRPRLLALECDPEQARPISEALLNGGAHDVAVQKDFASRDRVVTGRWGREA